MRVVGDQRPSGCSALGGEGPVVGSSAAADHVPEQLEAGAEGLERSTCLDMRRLGHGVPVRVAGVDGLECVLAIALEYLHTGQLRVPVGGEGKRLQGHHPHDVCRLHRRRPAA